MKISYKVLDDFSIEIYQDNELVIHQHHNPSNQKKFSSEEDAIKWYEDRGFYLAGGTKDENGTSSEA